MPPPPPGFYGGGQPGSPGYPPGQPWPGGGPGYPPVPGQLAEWGPRAGAYLLDAVIIGVPAIILFLLGQVSAFFAVLGYLLAIGGSIWFAVQVGSTGQSPGMRMVGLRCVSTKTGAVLGGGMGVVRMLCHSVLGVLCGIGTVVDLLFPLWDDRKQTIADKMVSTVVVTVPKRPFSLTP